VNKLNRHIRLLVLSALFAALTFAAMWILHIPMGTGYIHPGDAVIYLAAVLLPTPYAAVSAAIGGGLSDLISGFPMYIIPTLLIKAVMALFFIPAKSGKGKHRALNARTLAASIAAGLFMAAGYYAADLVIDPAYALLNLPGNLIQAAAGTGIFAAASAVIDRTGIAGDGDAFGGTRSPKPPNH